MSTDVWVEVKEGDGFTETPKMEIGRHDPVTIVRTGRETKAGVEYERDGVKQLMVIFADEDGAQHQNYYDLGGQFGWVFSNLVIHAGLDVEKMKQDKIGFDQFKDNEFASLSLVNRRLGIDLNPSKNGGERLYARSFATEAQQEQLPELPADAMPEGEEIPF